MPIHDWTRVQTGIFHNFHHAWVEEIKRALNRGLLPPGSYALVEQITGGLKVQFHARTEADIHADKAKAIAIRHGSNF